MKETLLATFIEIRDVNGFEISQYCDISGFVKVAKL